MTIVDRTTLQDEAVTIRDELAAGANTATRVGGLLKDLADTVTIGGVSPLGTPGDGDTIAFDPFVGAPVWVSRTPFSILSFSAEVSLIEIGGSAVSPRFTATLSADLGPGDTAILTDNADVGAKDVHASPLAFSSDLTFAFTAPGQLRTFTYSVKKIGNALAFRATTVSAAHRNYAGVMAHGASLEALVSNASVNELSVSSLFSFTVTDDGTHQVQLARPSRFGVPIVKDRATGFGVGITLLGTTLFTNASGFAENIDQYALDAPITGSKTLDVVA